MAIGRRARGLDPVSGRRLLTRRLAVDLAGGGALLYVTVAATIAQVTAKSAPATALQAWPMSATAAARAAEAELVAAGGEPKAMAGLHAKAAQALLREPVNVVAARVAALAAASGDDAVHGRRLLRYADMLSRRDLGTQVALIELAVAAGDVETALRHYDVALRTGDTAGQLLMPVLVTASRTPAVAAPLRTLLRRRPPWRMQFIYNLLTAQPWAPTFVPLVEAAHLNGKVDLERDFASRIATGLVARGALTDAVRIYSTALGRPLAAGVRNGDFAAEDRIPPFDWRIEDEPGLSASKGPVDGEGPPMALSISVDSGRAGPVARQLLLLPPGSHELRFIAGSVDGSDRSSVTLSCNGTDAPLAGARLPTTIRPKSVQVRFDIPSHCPAQWLTVRGETDIDATAGRPVPWIGNIAIAR